MEQYSEEYKKSVVLKSFKGRKSVEQVAKENNLSSELLSKWREDFLAQVSEDKELRRLQEEKEELKKKLREAEKEIKKRDRIVEEMMKN